MKVLNDLRNEAPLGVEVFHHGQQRRFDFAACVACGALGNSKAKRPDLTGKDGFDGAKKALRFAHHVLRGSKDLFASLREPRWAHRPVKEANVKKALETINGLRDCRLREP